MIYLNYTNLDAETQERLMQTSKADIEHKFGTSLKAYALKYHLNYQSVLEEEATRNLYRYKFIFRI